MPNIAKFIHFKIYFDSLKCFKNRGHDTQTYKTSIYHLNSTMIKTFHISLLFHFFLFLQYFKANPRQSCHFIPSFHYLYLHQMWPFSYINTFFTKSQVITSNKVNKNSMSSNIPIHSQIFPVFSKMTFCIEFI